MRVRGVSKAVGVAACAATLLGSGIAVAAMHGVLPNSPQLDTPPQFAPTTGPIEPFGRNLASDLQTMAAGLPMVRDPQMSRIDLPDAPVHGSLLKFDLAVPTFDGQDIAEAMWQADLFAGAISERFQASGLGRLADVEETLVTPSGARRIIGGRLGSVVVNQRFNAAPATIGETVAARASRYGLSDVHVSLVHALQDAVIIRARTDTPDSSAESLDTDPNGALSVLLNVKATDYEGVYLEVSDSANEPVFISAIAPIDGGSLVWVRPGINVPIRGR